MLPDDFNDRQSQGAAADLDAFREECIQILHLVTEALQGASDRRRQVMAEVQQAEQRLAEISRERQMAEASLKGIRDELDRFGYDAQMGQVVVAYTASFAAADGAQVQTRRFEATAPADGTGATVGPALNRAANEVAREVANWIGG